MIDPGNAAWRRANGDHPVDARPDWPQKLNLQAAPRDPRRAVPFQAAVMIRRLLPSLPIGKYLPGQFAICPGEYRKFDPRDTRLEGRLEHGRRHIAPRLKKMTHTMNYLSEKIGELL